MLVTVLRAFAYAHDGFTVRTLTPSDRDPPEQEEVRDWLVPGLVAAGLVSQDPEARHVEAIEPQADHSDASSGPAEGQQAADQPADADDAAALTEIPDGWASLHWKQRVALAKKLGWVDGEPTTDQADGWISDTVEHRRREVPQEALGGLSIREAHDKLTKAGIEWNADATVADLSYLLAKAKD